MKFLKNIFVFLIILFLAQYSLIFIINRSLEISSFRFSKLYTSKIDADAIVIGNSRGVNSVYTPYLNKKKNLKFYNLSYNGLDLKSIQILLKDYLRLQAKPKYVFIEVSSLLKQKLINTKVHRSLIMYSNFSNELKKQYLLDHPKSAIINYLPLYSYNSELLLRNLYYVFEEDQKWINRYRINDAIIQQTIDIPSIDLYLQEDNIELLIDIKNFLKNNEIELIPFIAPYLPTYFNKFNNFELRLDELNQKLDLDVIDLTSLISDISSFADRIHTNDKGARIISDTLYSTLNQ